MRQRGRRSSADLELNGAAPAGVRLVPPDILTSSEARLFREVVSSAPAGQFTASDVYLLCSFVRITLVCDDAAKSLAKATEKTRPIRMKILDQAVKMQALLASKLRLAPQARVSGRSLARASDAHRPSVYDTGWDWQLDDETKPS